jgi:hypothetical protein
MISQPLLFTVKKFTLLSRLSVIISSLAGIPHYLYQLFFLPFFFPSSWPSTLFGTLGCFKETIGRKNYPVLLPFAPHFHDTMKGMKSGEEGTVLF